ncbi:MAG: DNA polymerase III subunit delta', partial [Dehalococcoidia bacterium]|nr:DNA polymerase III subunit delta' [Dehalococcoidia bacterium]
VCSVCQRIASFAHPDIRVIALGGTESDDDARATTEISINQIRDDIQHWVSLPAFEGGFRVFIIGDAELLSSEAANCLLKTLEEPQEKVLFLLLSSAPSRLPETVISRCQCLELKAVAEEKIKQALIERGVPFAQAQLLSRLSHGCPGVAFSAIDEDSTLSYRMENLERFCNLISGDTEVRFGIAAELSLRFTQKRKEVFETLVMWQGFWRDLLLLKLGNEEDIVYLDCTERLQPFVQEININDIREGIKSLVDACEQLRKNANPRLVFEVMMLDMPLACLRN